MRKSNHINPATIAARANGAIDSATGGVVPAIGTSTTFIRDSKNDLVNEANRYSRDDSEVTRTAEGILSVLEGAAQSLLFPSGMAATVSVMRTVENGGKIILHAGIYWGTTKWVRDFCKRRDVDLCEIDCSDTGMLTEKIRSWKPDIVFVETPTNPWLKIIDIRNTAKACKQSGAILIVDSTAATPVLSQPLSMGADIVMHSATKAINGHSDVLAGALSVRDEALSIWQAIRMDRHDAGAVLGSFESWLLIRGMRTLPLRVERMCENALVIAKYLDSHNKIEKVLYPGLSNHPGHELALEQMLGGFGFLMSFMVRGDKSATLKVCGALNLIHRATSLGGVESLIEHRQTIEDGIPENLLRLSVGIEHVDDLIADLDQALAAI